MIRAMESTYGSRNKAGQAKYQRTDNTGSQSGRYLRNSEQKIKINGNNMQDTILGHICLV